MSVPSTREPLISVQNTYKAKNLFSPQPVKKRSEAESRLLSRPLKIDFSCGNEMEKKCFSMEAIGFEPVLNRTKSVHFISTFSFVDDFNDQHENKKTHFDEFDEEEKISIIDQIRKDCFNPHFKDPFFMNNSNENLEEIFDIDV